MAHDTKGDFILVAGFGYYPNRNIMDAFMCLAVEGKTQHVVRASRELRPRIDEITVGPFSWDVIEPMKKLRASLDENEYGVSYDITSEGTMPPHEEDPPQFNRFRGRVIEDICRYFQVGRPSGWVKVNGQTVKIDPDSWRTERDHSWGIRRGAVEYQEVGVQPGEIPVGFFYSGGAWQFDSWGANYHIREDGDGRINNFSYANYRGFTHGLWMDPSWMDGFTLDISDPAVIREVSYLDELACELRCGNQVGYGMTEATSFGRCMRYGYEGY